MDRAETTGRGPSTFLFTDIEGSTSLWEHAGEQMTVALARHDQILRAAVEDHGGRIFATGGDGVAAVFAMAVHAAGAAITAQRLLAAEPWPDRAPIRVRMAMHTGHAEERGGDYFGPALNRTARLMSAGHGGQILCSRTTADFLAEAGDVTLVDLGSHRLRDLLAPMPIVQIGDATFPPLRSLDSVPSNLPVMVTDLVGRGEDVGALAAEVGGNRLVTLTGVGGVGKTRLALAVAAAVAPDFPDGCWFVELAPVSDPSEVVRAVAGSIASSGLTAADRSSLLRYLEHRRQVLILDNCEHLLDECAALVADLTASTADVHVVATSREPLGIDGEVVRRVRSLDLPDGDLTVDEAAGVPAVRLFVERARAASGEFALNDGNVAAVCDICRHLDGIPLAIELAAARVRAMAPAEIARRLDDRFRVLTGGRRAQERHRTLLATVAWSYDLLPPAEQHVFAALSVFPATFDLAAVTAIVEVEGLDEIDLEDAVVRLVERSLVVHDHATGRYRLLETLRQFGADRLADLRRAEELRGRYLDHYLTLVQTVGPGVIGGRDGEAILVLMAEFDNIRATVELLDRRGRHTDIVRLCLAGGECFSQLVPGEGMVWLRNAIERSDLDDPAELARGYALLSLMDANSTAFDETVRHATLALELADRHGFPDPPWAHFSLSMRATITGDMDEAMSRARHGVAAAAALDQEFVTIVSLAQGTVPLMMLGQHEEADRWAGDSLRRAVALENAAALGVALICTCTAILFGSDPPDRTRALALLDAHASDALAAYGGLNVSWLLTNRAVAGSQRDPIAAVRDAIEAARVADRSGADYPLGAALDVLSHACALAGRATESRRVTAYLEAHDTGRYDMGMSVGSGWLAREREAALVALDGDGTAATEPTVPQNRRELFALLAEIEAALPSPATAAPAERAERADPADPVGR